MVPEVEELAVMWSDVEHLDIAEQEVFRANFWALFGHRLDAKYGLKQLSDIDFSAIRAWKERTAEQKKEERKSKPLEVRKKEEEEKQKKAAFYQYCVIDGEPQKVNASMTEPPAIFRGRGEHPQRGKLKSRIVPEYVTINVGEDDMIPPCPVDGHAWKEVVHNPKASWLCQYKDE